MEEEKVTKKSIPVPVIAMIAAVVLIAAGAILIVTGNNKNLLGGNKEEAPTEEKKEEPKKEEPKEDPKRNLPKELSNEDTFSILIQQYEAGNHAEEGWSIQDVTSVEAGVNNAYLVRYGEATPDGMINEKVTIIFLYDGASSVELPGWYEYERDLSEYHFGETLEEQPTQPEQPVEEPPMEEQLTEEQLDEINRVTEQTTE